MVVVLVWKDVGVLLEELVDDVEGKVVEWK